MGTFALDERSDLAATLSTTAPDAATLCGDWNTAQLAAHLVLRERSVTELLGRLPVARLQAVAQRSIDDYVARHPYPQIVDTLASGAPRFSPFALPALREAVNLLEYVVHHEDVRRAAEGWAPRAVPVDRQQAIWSRLRTAARLTLRGLPVATRLEWPGHGTLDVGRGAARVTAAGDPVELALFAFGRQRVARLDYTGSPEDVEAVRTARVAV